MYSVILFSTAALLIIPSILLLTGRGAFLIAGYNTASPAEKAVYDEKKLCRITGGGVLVIGILVLIMAFLGESLSRPFVIAATIITLLDTIVMVWLCNSPWVRSASAAKVEKPAQHKKAPLISAVITTVSLLLITPLLFAGDIIPEYGDTAVHIKASYWKDLTIPYETISAIDYRDEAMTGSRTEGLGSFRLLLGKFINEEFGSYTRYTYTGCDACVVLHSRGQIIVLSGEDEAATRAIYDTLCQRAGLS